MLKYCKTVLQKVSFNRDLFRKELRKSIHWLAHEDALMLKAWCIIQFGSLYSDLIRDVFENSGI